MKLLQNPAKKSLKYSHILLIERGLIIAGEVIGSRGTGSRLKHNLVPLLRRIILRIVHETRRDGSRSRHETRRSESLTGTLPSFSEALIDQFVLAHRVNTPKASLARLILRPRDFDEASVQAEVVTNAVLPSFVCSGTIIGIRFGDVRVDAGQCELLVGSGCYRLHD